MWYSLISKQRTVGWRRGFTVLEVVVLLMFMVVMAAFLFPFFAGARDKKRRSSCQSNLKQLGVGFKQYIRDYDEIYPIAKSSTWGYGWANIIQPYVKSTPILQCPAESHYPTLNPTQPEYTDYWYNARVSGVTESRITYISALVLLGDGNDGKHRTDARYHLLSLPNQWRSNSSSPLYRHLEGANFCFADGHVKWLKADSWTDNVSSPWPNGYSKSQGKFGFLLGG